MQNDNRTSGKIFYSINVIMSTFKVLELQKFHYLIKKLFITKKKNHKICSDRRYEIGLAQSTVCTIKGVFQEDTPEYLVYCGR